MGNVSKKSITISNIDKKLPEQIDGKHMAISRVNDEYYIRLEFVKSLDVDSGIAKVIFYYKESTEDTFTKAKELNYAEINGTTTGITEESYISANIYLDSSMVDKTYSAYAEFYDVAGNVAKSYLATINPDGRETSYTSME